MTPENFCYWLQGFFEINRKNTLTPFINITPLQSQEIENHLNLVFHKVTPSNTEYRPFIEVQYLNAISC